MSTQNLVPRGDLTGSIGTTSKRWATGSFGVLLGDGSGITGVTGEWDGSLNGNASITGSLTVSSSAVDFTNSTGVSGSFSGSFVGNGSGLTDITATATPGGSNTDIQFNQSSNTSGSSNLQYDYTNDIFKVNAGQTSKTTRITAATYTVLSDDFRVGVSWTLSASVNIQLPLVSDVPNQNFRIKDEHGNCSTNNIHVLASGSDLIDNAATASMKNNYAAIQLYNDGVSRWFVE